MHYLKLLKYSRVKDLKHGKLLERALIFSFKALHTPHQGLFLSAFKICRDYFEKHSSKFTLLEELRDLKLVYGGETKPSKQASIYIEKAKKVFNEIGTELLNAEELRDDEEVRVYHGEFCYAAGKGNHEFDRKETIPPTNPTETNRREKERRNKRQRSRPRPQGRFPAQRANKRRRF